MRSLAFLLSMSGLMITAAAASRAEAAELWSAAGPNHVVAADLRTDVGEPGIRIEPIRHRRYYYSRPGYYYRPYYYQPYHSYRPYGYYDYPYYGGGYYGRPYWDHGNVAPGVYFYWRL
jgi:hypothetical protein